MNFVFVYPTKMILYPEVAEKKLTEILKFSFLAYNFLNKFINFKSSTGTVLR